MADRERIDVEVKVGDSVEAMRAIRHLAKSVEHELGVLKALVQFLVFKQGGSITIKQDELIATWVDFDMQERKTGDALIFTLRPHVHTADCSCKQHG